MMLAATRPSASSTTKLGIELGVRVPEKASIASPSGEKYATAWDLSKGADEVLQNFATLLVDAKQCSTREEAFQLIRAEARAR